MADSQDKTGRQDMAPEGLPTAAYGSASLGPGAVIGRYKLLRILGEGGYGIVYLAEQLRPVKRRVALKVIKPGMDTKQVIARFEAERQALTLLDHPNIAKVFNAGTTEVGRPYFAMEYVKGVPITEHCDRYKLTIEERLKLFLAVCEAVQHAHQKAIIHRDIKPSNILVTYEGEKALPMIIDFGVAKALNRTLTDTTLVTEQAQMIGTPEYMSPEQAEMTGQDIDTRTDIYSLGVLLYELLTGTLPFDPHTLREGGLEQMRQMIREQDPQTPSARLGTIERDESLSLAQHRRTDSRALGRRLHGELDWITLKAMDKDRTRRYQTAHALAEDIHRYLNEEPVLAGPPSAVYKAHKFIKRNRTLFVSSRAIVAMLILAVIVSTHQALVARKARRVESMERRAAQEAEQQARENLYDALVREARAIRVARRIGYRDEVFSALQRARGLNVPQKNLAELRNEVIACLGDFVGLKPRSVFAPPDGPTGTSISWAVLHPTEPMAAFALSDGTVRLWDLHLAKEIASFNCEDVPRGLCFARTGSTLLSLHMPNAFSSEERPAEMVARLFIRRRDHTWVQEKQFAMPGAVDCLSTEAGFRVIVIDEASHSVQVVEPLGGNIVHQSAFPEGPIGFPQVDMTPDNRMLAVGLSEPANPEKSSIADVWDVTRSEHLIRLEPGLATCTALRFSPDGRYLVFLSVSGASVYSTETWKPVGHFADEFVNGSDAIFFHGSDVLALSIANRVSFWDCQRRMYLATFEHPAGEVVGFSKSVDDKSVLVYNFGEAWIQSLDAENEKLVLRGHTAGTPAVDFGPDGSCLASVGKDRKLRVWNSITGDLEWEQPLESQGETVAYNADGRWLATGELGTGDVNVWNTETHERLLQLSGAPNTRTWSAQFTDDNRYLVIATENLATGKGALAVWSLKLADSGTGASLLEARLVKSWPGKVMDLTVAPDSRQFVFVNSSSAYWDCPKELYRWDFAEGGRPELLVDGVRGSCRQMVSFMPNSRAIVFVDANRNAVTYDIPTRKPMVSFPTLEIDHQGASLWNLELCLSPDGETLALATPAMLAVDLWHCESGRLRYTLPQSTGRVYSLKWSPDARRLAVAWSDGVIDIWNLVEIERVLAELGLAP